MWYGFAHLITAYVYILTGKQTDDLFQYTFQELKGAFFAGTVHVLMHSPMNRHLCHITCCQCIHMPAVRPFQGSDAIVHDVNELRYQEPMVLSGFI